jgi:hypothetical protein
MMGNKMRVEKPGLTRFGLRVTENDEDGTFTFTVLVSETGKQLGNAQLSLKDSLGVAAFIKRGR